MSARSRRECAVLPPPILYANFCCLFEPLWRPGLNPEIYGSRSYMFELAAGRELDKIKILCYNSKKKFKFLPVGAPPHSFSRICTIYSTHVLFYVFQFFSLLQLHAVRYNHKKKEPPALTKTPLSQKLDKIKNLCYNIYIYIK